MHISNKCSIAVHCLIFINEYGEENKVTSELLSLSTGCNPVTIRNIISAMKKDGIIDVKFGTGGTALAVPIRWRNLHFNPRSPCGERRLDKGIKTAADAFQSTLPVRGATGDALHRVCTGIISIHAPRAGSDFIRTSYASVDD